VVVAVETVPEDRPTDVTQQRAQLAREARTVLAPAAGATAPAAAAVVLVVVVTAPATAALAPAAPTLGPVGPTLGEVVAEVRADRLADTVEVDPDGLEGLAVVVVAAGLAVSGVLGLGVCLDVVRRDDLASAVEVEAVVAEGGVRRAPRVGEQAEQEVAGADLPVAELAGDVRRLGDGDT
jgi:hypothetical protein